jgi:peptidyl-prolyl cis-trans isomerase B (cyclophilin B)
MKSIQLLMVSALLFLGVTACNSDKNTSTMTSDSAAVANGAKVRIKTVHGDIVYQFYPDKAPNTVKRITTLIKDGFYDGLIFHRVVPGFVIQGGDPTGTGRGGSGKNLKAEFSDLKHVKGSVAMARAADPDSADSQFYIALNATPHLDGKYTIFGMVTEGMEVLDKVSQGDKMLTVTLE